MQSSIASVLPVDQADRHGHGKGISVFQCHGTLQPNHIIGQRDMVIIGSHRAFHHAQSFRVLAAESYLGLVMEHQFV